MADKELQGKITIDFSEAKSRQTLETGEHLPTLMGKIKKFFTDLKTVAFTGSYTDLSNTPTIPTKVSQLTNDSGFTKVTVDSALSSTSTNPVQNKIINTALAGKAASSHTHTKSQITDFPSSLPANGGNSATVNGKTVATNVPANAVFTDTIGKIYYAECSDARNVIAKTVTCDGFVLETGAIIAIRFTTTDNTAPSSGNMSLNINGTGVKNIVSKGSNTILNYNWSWAFRNNQTWIFTYNGTYYVMLNQDNNNTYTPMSLGFGYGTCATAEATTAKVATLASYGLVKNGIVAIKFTYAVPANATLNINSKGAKNIFYRGAKIVANIIKAGDIATFVYDGTQYQLLTVDRDNNTTYSNFVKSGTGAKAGLVPAPSTTAGTTKYLREDGTWQVPPDTNTKVTNTLATTTKAYVTGTTSATTNTGTQVFDTGVYLDTTAGQLTATTFKGALSGNASTATTATKVGTATVGSATQPVYINAGVPTKCTYTLGKSVPSNAVFTDTKYSVASTTANGLMSAADKAKLDGIAEGASKVSSASYQTIQQMTEF